ncbi:MAG: glycerol-1-phosphate dehydrogenase [NAD(P)+] [Myxococcota bacterium]|jgi:glycerol-1-phosphate dehydrogenase [NAD(P)+]
MSTLSETLAPLLRLDPEETRGRTRHIALGSDALPALAAWLANGHAGSSVVVVSDAHTFEAAGEAVEAALVGHTGPVRRLILEPRTGDDHLVCEDGVIDALRTIGAAMPPSAVIVAVGAGTVNDIVKMASFQLGRDYVVVPTAASMNGYTSAIAAVLRGGVKRTLPAHQPVAIFADTVVLRAAPPHLTRAGFGDLLSKPVSQADWLLSHLVRDVPYSPRPGALLDATFPTLLREAGAIGRAEPAGIALLMEAILVSGFSMTVAGTSAPASGGEHLISHYWDMEQLDAGKPLMALHGTQVGIATRLSALLWEQLMALDVPSLDLDALCARRADNRWLASLETSHAALRPAVVAEIRDQLASKQRHGKAFRAELERVRQRWPEIRATLEPSLFSSATITKALQAAGCADRASAIGIDRARLIHTIVVCRHMRGRYVGLDLLDDLNVLDRWAVAAATATEEDRPWV